MIDLGGFFGAIIIGGVAGWLASLIMRTDQSMGLLANIIVGILGAIIGNLLLGLLAEEGTSGFSFRSLLVAVLGAVILLFLVKLFRGRRSTA